jgi:hypothetical protein
MVQKAASIQRMLEEGSGEEDLLRQLAAARSAAEVAQADHARAVDEWRSKFEVCHSHCGTGLAGLYHMLWFLHTLSHCVTLSTTQAVSRCYHVTFTASNHHDEPSERPIPASDTDSPIWCAQKEQGGRQEALGRLSLMDKELQETLQLVKQQEVDRCPCCSSWPSSCSHWSDASGAGCSQAASDAPGVPAGLDL